MPYTKFAVVGAGQLGSVFIKHLAATSQVTVLTRSASIAGLPAGIKVAQVEYALPESLDAALKGCEVIISPVSGPALQIQYQLIDAAKRVGCSLLVPSEFGNSTIGQRPGDRFYEKVKVRAYAAQAGLPTLAVFTGAFMEPFVAAPPFGFNWAANQVTMWEGGDYLIQMTRRDDIGRFVAHALTTFPNSALHNHTIRLAGDTQSPLALAASYEETHPGTKLTFEHKTLEDLEDDEANAPPPVKFLKGVVHYNYAAWIAGTGVVGASDQLSNGLWPEWCPVSAREFLSHLP